MRLGGLVQSLLSLFGSRLPMSAPPDSDHHPAALRNRGPILEQLQLLLPPASGLTGLALEVASGTGAHLEVFAPAFPSLTFQPSEYVPADAAPEDEQWSRHGKIGSRAGRDELACLDSYGCARFTNVRPAVPLDLSVPWDAWPKAVTENEGRFVLMLCSNVLHITPWECTLGFMSGGGKALAPGGHLFVYGPFKVGGQFIGDDGGAGNQAFDLKLRETNGAWAMRDVEKVSEAASAHGLTLKDQVGMPANNLLLHFVKE